MNLLFVGFSEQNVAALQLLCTRKFKSIRSLSVKRQLSAKMKLILPSCEHIADTIDAFMIDLDWVGLPRHSTEAQAALLKFLGNKPAVLLSKRDLKDSQAMAQVTSAPLFYLRAPFYFFMDRRQWLFFNFGW